MKDKISAIPEGYHSITPYLVVDQAKKAIEFYKKAFAAEEVMKMERPGDKISHAELKIGDSKLMLCDEFPEMNIRSAKSYGGTPVMIHLYVEDVDAIVNRAVAASASLLRPVENMFYGDRSGVVIDPYGHVWHISSHVENVPFEELKKRADEIFKNKNYKK